MIRARLRDLVDILRDRIAVWQLQRTVSRLKALRYDQLANTVRGLRRVLKTQERALADAYQRVEALEAEAASVRAEYAALAAGRDEMIASAVRDERLAIFRRLQMPAIQIPTLLAALEQGNQVAPDDALRLIAPLGQALADLGFVPIGEVGAEASYDPRLHRAAGRGGGGGARSRAPGAPVRCRYIGYLYQGEVVCKADVIPLVASEGAAAPAQPSRTTRRRKEKPLLDG